MSTPHITYAKEPVKLEFDNGVTLHLRYSAGAIRRITEKYPDGSFLRLSLPDFIPVIHEGLVEKDSYTVEKLEDMVTGQMSHYIFDQFMLAFKGKTLMQHLEEQRDLKNVVSGLSQ